MDFEKILIGLYDRESEHNVYSTETALRNGG